MIRIFKRFRNEVDFKLVTPQEMHRRVLEDGCCLLRGALAKEDVLRYRDMCEGIFKDTATRVSSGEDIVMPERVHITDHQFTARYGKENSYFKLLKDPKYTEFFNSLFGRDRYQYAFGDTYTRSCHVDEKKSGDTTSFLPLPVHLDGLYHMTRQFFSVNFWIPFEECGPGTNGTRIT